MTKKSQNSGHLSVQLQKPPLAIIIAVYMNRTYEIKKYEADKIALLGLFIVGLLIAHFITSSRYTGPLNAGREVVAEIKRKGISSFLDDRGWQSFFLIKDARDRAIGFTMDVFTDPAPDTKLNIQSAGLLYIRGRYGQEHLFSFQSDNSFDEFSWKSETAGPKGRSGTEILLGEDGVLTVTGLSRNKKVQSYKPGSASIPNFLLDLVFSQMLDSARERIIVDTIDAGGKMVEVLICKIKSGDSGPSPTGPAYELNVEFLDERGVSEKVYFNSRGRISKILLRQNGLYLFERTDAENILRQFPERADYILKKK